MVYQRTDKPTTNTTPVMETYKYLTEELIGEVYKTLVLLTLLCSTAVKIGPCRKICSSALEVFITGVLAQCEA